MEFKGTKGEWYVGDDCDIISKLVEERVKNHKDPLVSEKDNGEIAQCWQDYYDGTIISTEEAKANAQLIATAPKLLEALKGFVTDFKNDFVVDGKIVDNPDNMLVTNYEIFKNLINQATKII
jgi:hypothetical protein